MEAPSTLSHGQKSVLTTTHHCLESMVIYLRSILPVVDETDERLLKAMVASAESSMRSLALFFPELQPLAEEWKKRGGAH